MAHQRPPVFRRPVRVYLTLTFWIALGALSVALLAGCGDAPPAQPTLSAERTPAPDPTPTRRVRTALPSPTLTPSPLPTLPLPTLEVEESDLQGITVRFWYAGTDDAWRLLNTMAGEFNRSNPWGVRVETRRFVGYGELEDRLRETLVEGRLPDLLAGYTYQALRWDASGRFLVDLEAYLQDPQWGIDLQEQADFFPAFWEQDVRPAVPGVGGVAGEGKRLGIPWQRTGLVLLYNRTWARELGFSAQPATPEQFREQACAAAETGEDRAGWLVTPEPFTLALWVYAHGGEIARQDGKGYSFDTPEALQALRFLRGLLNEDCARFITDLYPAEAFAERGGLFYAAPLAALPLQQAAFTASGSRDSWTVIPFPSTEGEPVIGAYGPSLYVLRSSLERQVAAWVFVRWLISPQNQARWAQAIGVLPVRTSALELVEARSTNPPQWQAALELAHFSRVEPGYASWSVVRLALSDALAELFSASFTAGRIPALLDRLEQVASEIHSQVR